MVKRVLVALGVLVAAFLLVWQIRYPSGTTYRGKSLQFWLQQYAKASQSHGGHAAVEASEIAIRHMGTNALPTLLAWTSKEDTTFKKYVLALTQKPPFSKLHFLSAEEYRVLAGYGFGVLMQAAEPAVPSLIMYVKWFSPKSGIDPLNRQKAISQ